MMHFLSSSMFICNVAWCCAKKYPSVFVTTDYVEVLGSL